MSLDATALLVDEFVHQKRITVTPDERARLAALASFVLANAVITPAPERTARHCQAPGAYGFGDICAAAARDGVVCPEDSCDIDEGVRPALTAYEKRIAPILQENARRAADGRGLLGLPGRTLAEYMAGYGDRLVREASAKRGIFGRRIERTEPCVHPEGCTQCNWCGFRAESEAA
jgi:hypothetical protein